MKTLVLAAILIAPQAPVSESSAIAVARDFFRQVGVPSPGSSGKARLAKAGWLVAFGDHSAVVDANTSEIKSASRAWRRTAPRKSKFNRKSAIEYVADIARRLKLPFGCVMTSFTFDPSGARPLAVRYDQYFHGRPVLDQFVGMTLTFDPHEGEFMSFAQQWDYPRPPRLYPRLTFEQVMALFHQPKLKNLVLGYVREPRSGPPVLVWRLGSNAELKGAKTVQFVHDGTGKVFTR